MVVQAGPLCTLQDLGRRGQQRYGVPVAGAMDVAALAAANRLAGNTPDMAAIEVALGGLRLRATTSGVMVAIAGAATLSSEGHEFGGWRSLRLARGQTVSIVPDREGVFAYLAVRGGFQAAGFLDSLSTHTRAGMGGLNGGPLQAGDRLPVLATGAEPREEVYLPGRDRLGRRETIRVVWGPQQDFFDAATRGAFTSRPFTVTRQADRMGYQLEGPQIRAEGAANIISEGIAPGSIQVPGSGKPIVLMADRQSVGGYPKIATVISSDLGDLAQHQPGESIRFRAIDLDEAVSIRRDRQAWIDGLADRFVRAY